MDPRGYAVTKDYTGQFVLKYYPDVNIENSCYVIATSYSYDEIMRSFLHHREMQGVGREYWIS